jgi:hypothetical protein
VLWPFFFVSLLSFGFRTSDIDADSEFQLCLHNASFVAFRSPRDHDPLAATIFGGDGSSDHFFKRSVRHFSVSDKCLILKRNSSEVFSHWIIPQNLCPAINLVNVYGYSYKYSLTLDPGIVTCVFFSTFSSRHHISLTSANAESPFTAEFYTTSSLHTGGASKTATTTDTSSFSSGEPFFVRLSTPSKRIKTLYVSTATFQFQILYAKCRVEEIAVAEDVRADGVRVQSSDVSSEVCVNPIDEIATISIDVLAIAVVLMLCIAVLDRFGCLSWKSVLCCVATRRPFRDFSSGTLGMIGVDPSDDIDVRDDNPL